MNRNSNSFAIKLEEMATVHFRFILRTQKTMTPSGLTRNNVALKFQVRRKWKSFYQNISVIQNLKVLPGN